VSAKERVDCRLLRRVAFEGALDCIQHLDGRDGGGGGWVGARRCCCRCWCPFRWTRRPHLLCGLLGAADDFVTPRQLFLELRRPRACALDRGLQALRQEVAALARARLATQ
jgi:hypothetical protein